MIMKIITRYFGAALVAGALLVPTGIAAPAAAQDHPQRYYDRDRKDYHEWTEREQHAYREWMKEQHKNYREYSKLNSKRQREYWRWRHEHPQEYR
jgi:hypothetical protein